MKTLKPIQFGDVGQCLCLNRKIPSTRLKDTVSAVADKRELLFIRSLSNYFPFTWNDAIKDFIWRSHTQKVELIFNLIWRQEEKNPMKKHNAVYFRCAKFQNIDPKTRKKKKQRRKGYCVPFKLNRSSYLCHRFIQFGRFVVSEGTVLWEWRQPAISGRTSPPPTHPSVPSSHYCFSTQIRWR